MPTTPVTWLDDFVVNLTTTGGQFNPRITHLTNGNILIVWDSDDDTGVGSPSGSDVIGQLFNPAGERVGGEFLVNHSPVNGNQHTADIAASPTGGYLTAFQGISGSNSSISLVIRDVPGLVTNPSAINIVPIVGMPGLQYTDPRVAVSSPTSALVVYRFIESGSESAVWGRFVNPTTAVANVGGETVIFNGAGTNTNPDIAVLTNGSYVVVATTTAPGQDSSISLRILGGTTFGPIQIAGTVGGDLENDHDPSVTALTGGGFVVTWTSTEGGDTDIKAQIFTDAGATVGSLITVNDAGATDNNNEPAVVALLDGGFIVIYDNDVAGVIQAQRYEADGDALGTAITISSGAAAGSIDAELLKDGRVAVTFSDADGEIRMEIIDVRDAPNDPAVYAPSAQVGTVGGDTFTTAAGPQRLFGHTGDDVFLIASPADFTGDTIDGGGGTGDTIRFTSATDAQLLILSSLVTGVEIVEISNAAGDRTGTHAVNLDASAVANALMMRGNAGHNTIVATGLGDIVDGGAGNDALFGDGGDDVFLIGNAADHAASETINGGAGDFDTVRFTSTAGGDTLVLTSGVTLVEIVEITDASGDASGTTALNLNAGAVTYGLTLNGNAGVNTISGTGFDDIIDGKGGGDTLVGDDGDDTFVLGAGNADIVEDPDEGTDTVTSTIGRSIELLANVENLTLLAGETGTGNGLVNTIRGNAAANSLNGLELRDTLIGGLASDTYHVDSSRDFVVEASGNAAGAADRVLFTGLANQTYVLAANVERLTLAGNAAVKGTGNILANTITGNAKANTLDGMSGNDILLGMNGNDILIGGAGRDTMTGGAHSDIFRFLVKTHSPNSGNRDTIIDFDDPGKGNDRIDVSRLFGSAMAYIHDAAFTKAGQVRIKDIGGPDVIVEVNTAGTTGADFSILLKNTTLASMAANDFVL